MKGTRVRIRSMLMLSGLLLGLLCAAGCEKKASSGAKIKIASVIFQDDEFFRVLQLGLNDAAGKAGVDLRSGNSKGNLATELQLINTYINAKVDAMVVSALSKEASMNPLKRAHDAGIKIVIVNMPLTADFPVSTIESDHRDLGVRTGREAARFIKEKLDGKAKVAILAFDSQLAEQSKMRTEGFKSQLRDLPGVEFVAQQDAWLVDMGIRKVDAILTAHPEVNLIWSANEGGTVGAVRAVEAKRMAGKVFVFGTDASEQLANALLSPDNILQAVTGQRPFDIGTEGIQAAIKAVKGETVEKKKIVDCMTLTREKPAEVEAFKKRQMELTR